MDFSIERFSAWFCLIVSTEEDSFKRDFESSCHLPIHMKNFQDIIYKLKKAYSKELSSAVVKEVFDFEKYCCFTDYMEPIIHKCLEFSTPPSHLRFLLMCTFIYEIISERTRRKKKCFVFAKIVSQCLIEVCNRHYKDLFENEGEIKLFETLCKELAMVFFKRMMISACRELKPLNQEDIVDLMNNLNTRQISRRRYELKILMATIVAAFPEDSSGDDEESTGKSESKPLMKEESSINEYECDETSSNKESSINESESDETSLNEESRISKSESDETSSNEKSRISKSESDETSSNEKSRISKSESDETSSNEESRISESESNDTSSKESSTNESTEGLSEEEESDDPNRVCEHCNMKCFQFVHSFLAKEFVTSESNL